MSKIKVGNKEYTLAELQVLEKAGVLNIGQAQKHDTTGTSQTAQTLHGANAGGYNGLLSDYGVRPDMYTTAPRTDSLFAEIPLFPSEILNEKIEILTGVTDVQGTNPTGFCGTPPTFGNLKVCQQIYSFGKFYLGSGVIDLTTVGSLVNRADTPRQLLNSGRVDNRLVPSILADMPFDTRDERASLLYTAGFGIERAFDRVSITGSTANTGNSAETGFIQEFNGLDALIKTGYVDADTSQACPAADSKVITFGANINNTIAGGDGRDLVEALVDLYTAQRDLAEMLGLVVDFRFVMTRAMFRVVSEVWACNYSTSRCSQGDFALNVYANDVVTLRDNMQRGSYLLISGEQIPVRFASGIPQGGGVTANSFTQDIYLVPMRVNGEASLYMDYFPMDNPYVQRFADMMPERTYMNNGLYAVSPSRTQNCIQFSFAAKPRLILRTPFLAGRLDDITFTDLRGTRTPYPDESFYANGGVTYRS